ncbi:unnamed protein product, partial [Effrenium voratum]
AQRCLRSVTLGLQEDDDRRRSWQRDADDLRAGGGDIRLGLGATAGPECRGE